MDHISNYDNNHNNNNSSPFQFFFLDSPGKLTFHLGYHQTFLGMKATR